VRARQRNATVPAAQRFGSCAVVGYRVTVWVRVRVRVRVRVGVRVGVRVRVRVRVSRGAALRQLRGGGL
jgi:hypothetical protein